MPFQAKQKAVTVNVFHPTKPHSTQAVVLDDPARFKILRAGRKWRKTSLMVSMLMGKAIQNKCAYPNCQANHGYAYIAPSLKQAKRIVWNDHVDRLLTHFKEAGLPFTPNNSELTITFPSGGRFEVFGVENKEAIRGISNWAFVCGDEYDDWDEDIWPAIMRYNLLPHKAGAMLAGTPKGKSGLWRMENRVNEDTGEALFKSFHYTSHDNDELDKEELEAIVKEAKAFGDDYYQQEILAEYIKPYGVVYKEFSERAQYVPLKYNPNLPVHLAIDPGVNDPTAIIWIQPEENWLNVIDYHEESNESVEYFASIIKGRGYHNPSLIVIDPAGAARTQAAGTNTHSVVAEYKRLNLYPTTLAFNPQFKDRIRAGHKMMPRLRIANNVKECQRFLDVINNYRYPEKKANLLDQQNEKPIHNWASHGASAFEYYAMVAPRREEGFDEGDFPEFDAISKDGWYA